jgi:hypothetical protein
MGIVSRIDMLKVARIICMCTMVLKFLLISRIFLCANHKVYILGREFHIVNNFPYDMQT